MDEASEGECDEFFTSLRQSSQLLSSSSTNTPLITTASHGSSTASTIKPPPLLPPMQSQPDLACWLLNSLSREQNPLLDRYLYTSDTFKSLKEYFLSNHTSLEKKLLAIQTLSNLIQLITKSSVSLNTTTSATISKTALALNADNTISSGYMNDTNNGTSNTTDNKIIIIIIIVILIMIIIIVIVVMIRR